MIKIEIPADRPDIALHLGAALTAIGNEGELWKSSTATPIEDFETFSERIIATLAQKYDIPVEALQKTIYPSNTDEKGIAEVASQAEADAGTDDNRMITPLKLANAGGTVTDINAGSDAHGQFNKDELEEAIVDPANVDPKGVPFNPDFCGKAASPFYKSGPREGQWKKRQGVVDAAYDEWYTGELANATQSTDTGQTQVDTSTAFGNGQRQEPAANIPHDAGTLMAWVAEMQTAGRLSQQQVNDAYKEAGLEMSDVFPSQANTLDVIKSNVGNVHGILSRWAGQ